jgi:outer membrane receptor protein involved in Fe transport
VVLGKDSVVGHPTRAMMKQLMLGVALVGSPTFLFAQTAGSVGAPPASSTAPTPSGDGKLTGTVLDASSQQPVPFATVALLNAATGKPVDGTAADEKGKFTLRNIAPGSYSLQISFVGYKPLEKTGLVFTSHSATLNLGNLTLTAVSTQLGEVVVQGQRALIEEKVDRTVYNAEQDQTTRGGDATDVLKRVPMLSVDLDGNVSMRGSSNIKVLINNRPSTIAASSVSDALKQIPADQIKSVEVITSPSAKYDAEGSGGIINIITKKDNLEGKTLDVRLSGGLRSADLGLSGGYHVGKMGFSLGGFGRVGYNTPGTYRNTQLTTDPTTGSQSLTTQQAATHNNYQFGRYTFGWDYDLNKHNSLAASAQLGVRNFNANQDGLLTQTFRGTTLQNTSLRDVELTDQTNNLDLSLSYTHLFEKPQHEFSLLGLYSRTNATNNFTNSLKDNSGEAVTQRLKNENDSYNQEVTVQADYQLPIGEKQLLEVGGKDIIRRVRSDYAYLTAAGANGDYQPLPSASLSNIFYYNQNVAAGYASYTLSFLEKYSLKAGARYEHTSINADFQTGQAVSLPSYGVLVPSLNLSRKLGNGNLLKAAYNRRIQRPSLQFLNPNVQAANPLSITQGNPLLQPEYTNNYELSYSTAIKTTSLNFSFFTRNTTSSIQPIRQVLGDTIRTTYANIGNENAYGGSVFFNVNIQNKLTLSGGPDVYYAVLRNNVSDPLFNASNRGWVVSGRLFGNYNLSKNWALQAFGFYRGRQVQLQGYQSGFGIYSLSLKRDLWDKRGSFGVGVDNFFTPTYQQRTEISSPILTQRSVNELKMLSFKANFSYRIGKLTAAGPPRTKKAVKNDDLKGGSSSDGQGTP